jgi:hypothetical protein
MQIRHTIQLFYAIHILTKNNLSALMINIDSNLLKMTEVLINDQDQWQHMKDKFRELRVRYYKLKEKVTHELNSAGLRISRRSKKINQSVNLDSDNDTRGICDQINWNVINNDTTVYLLTTSLISDKIICSLSNIKSDINYRYICENGL